MALFIGLAIEHAAPAQQQPGLPMADLAEQFEKRVRPLLVEHCFKCHGPDAEQGEGGLRVDSLAGLLRGGDSGPAIVRGQPQRSLLVLAVQHDPTLAPMPPKSKLKPEQIAALVEWVKLGAHWPNAVVPNDEQASRQVEHGTLARSHWSFKPPVAAPPPAVRDANWPRSPIDQFILSRLEEAGLEPAPEADRRTLVRRATYDLTGLPPSPEEVAQFAADDSPDAFARLVDRLLDSPRYGEHWGRHWLDVARYADTNGMDDNIAYADAWRYRDYVIDAFNTDLPFDQFAREQLAGDLLTSWGDARRSRAVVATGFLMVGPKMPSADDPIKQQLDIVDEQIDAISKAFLGLTLACARCHDHKYDPFPMRDYYALAGILQSTRTMLSFRVDAKYNLVALEGPAAQEAVSCLEAELDRHDDQLVNGNSLAMTAEERKTHEAALAEAHSRLKLLPTAMAVEEGVPQDVPVLARGNHLTPGPVVARGFPGVLSTERDAGAPGNESGRRQLAMWLTRPDHPLTARVLVNRVWQWHFGEGLVRTPDNFGRLGEAPTHPELLDWLAMQFVHSGWSVKSLHRLMLNSAAYRMAARHDERAWRLDPQNRLLWRHARRRQTVEELRDSLLAVGGRFDSASGGSMLDVPNHKIMSAEDIARVNRAFEVPRRTLYLPVVRSGLCDLLQAFDFPDPAVSTGRRQTTTVAPQALFLMNSRFVDECVAALARRVLAAAPDECARLESLFQLVLQRQPSPAEAADFLGLLAESTAGQMALGRDAPHAAELGWQALCRVLVSSNEFLFID